MTRRRRSTRLLARRSMCGFYRQGYGQKRLAFALTIGGGVCRTTLFNNVSEEGKSWMKMHRLAFGFTKEAPKKRHWMKYDLSSTYSN